MVLNNIPTLFFLEGRAGGVAQFATAGPANAGGDLGTFEGPGHILTSAMTLTETVQKMGEPQGKVMAVRMICRMPKDRH